MLDQPMDFKGALNSLLTNPSVAGTHQDEFGRYWVMFRFMVDSPNASSGTTLDLVDLDIVYDYSTVLNSGDGLDIELNQGIALWTGGATASVPVAVYHPRCDTQRFECFIQHRLQQHAFLDRQPCWSLPQR